MFFKKITKLKCELEETRKKLEKKEEIAKIQLIELKQKEKKISEQQEKIIDLENNIEILFNNLSKKKKELVLPELKTNSNA